VCSDCVVTTENPGFGALFTCNQHIHMYVGSVAMLRSRTSMSTQRRRSAKAQPAVVCLLHVAVYSRCTGGQLAASLCASARTAEPVALQALLVCHGVW
jgi:hypothetical protein